MPLSSNPLIRYLFSPLRVYRLLSRSATRWPLIATVRVIYTPIAIGGLLILLATSPISRRAVGIPLGRLLLLVYSVWFLLFDRLIGRQGGRPCYTMRNAQVWEGFREYLQAKIVPPSQPLDPDSKYIIGVHPHGIAGGSVFTCFVGRPNTLPGIDFRIATIPMNFYIPLARELLLSLGFVDSSEQSFNWALSHHISMLVVPGGAPEALDARPNSAQLTLAKRFGFIRLAMTNGAKLVPVYSLGENDMFESVLNNQRGTRLRAIQEWLLNRLSFSTPLFVGLSWILPLIPLPRPMTVMIGDPIQVPHISDPTPEQVEDVHRQYVNALRDLYRRGLVIHRARSKYPAPDDIELSDQDPILPPEPEKPAQSPPLVSKL